MQSTKKTKKNNIYEFICNTCDEEFYAYSDCLRCYKCGESTLTIQEDMNALMMLILNSNVPESIVEQADRLAERGFGTNE